MANAATNGYTFGATELVTNAKLHALVDSATITVDTLGAMGGTGGTDSAGSGKQYVAVSVGGVVNKVLHDGTI